VKPTYFKIVDFITRIIPSALFLIIVIGNVVGIYLLLKGRAPSGSDSESWRLAATVLAKASTTCFLALMSILFLIRIEPIRKASGIMPRAAAILGTFCLYFMTLFPRANLSVTWIFVAALISIVGTVFSIFTLAHLGRSFSLMAEARRLVTTGPYRFVRHPLYLFETVASLGILLQFLSVYAVLVFIGYMLIQLQRMKNEEAVLEKTFPEYKDYRAKTSRVIPAIY
jgi:protein-S-isoprenylcysteine O-methyltransferase Ste14